MKVCYSNYGENKMKMYKSVFEYPHYGMAKFYENKAEAATLLAKRKGKNSERRKEIRSEKRKELKHNELVERREVEARVLAISNKGK